MSLGWSPNPGGPVYMSSEGETPEMTLPSLCKHSTNTAVCQTRSHMLSSQTQSAHILSVWGRHPETPWSPPFPPRDSHENPGRCLWPSLGPELSKSEPCFFRVLTGSSRQEKALAVSAKRGQRETFSNALRVVTCGCLKKKKTWGKYQESPTARCPKRMRKVS